MNQTEFAAHIGVVKSYVTELKKNGRLVFTKDGKVDVEASVLRIAETADLGRTDVKDRHAEARGTDVTAPATGRKTKAKDPNEITHASAKANKEHWLGLQAKLDYEKSLGKLVVKEDVMHAVSDLVTTFRQELENIPHRIAADLVGRDVDGIRSTLKQEMHGALQNLQRGCTEKIQNIQEEAI
jgi:hypothetical protein